MDESIWAVVQPSEGGAGVMVIAMLPANCGAYARTLAHSISIGAAPNAHASALQMTRREIALALLRTQFGADLALKAADLKP